MVTLLDIRPTRKDHVFDLVQEAGVDVADWIASSNDSRGYKANPKYCYEWSFVEDGKVVVLNLWHDAMADEDGLIVQRNNFRADAEGNRAKPTWWRRATKLDETLQVALRQKFISPRNHQLRDHAQQGRSRRRTITRDCTSARSGAVDDHGVRLGYG